VLLDLAMPGCTGLEALIRFRELIPGARLVVVSSSEDPAIIRRAIRLGAAGYIPKTSSPRTLVGALELVEAGGTYVPPEAIADARDSPMDALTERQREVYACLMKGHAPAQIARELGISLATAKHHVRAVYSAFGVSSRAELILAVARRGPSGN